MVMDKEVFREGFEKAEKMIDPLFRNSEFTGLIARAVQSLAEELKEIKILLREWR